MAPILSFLISSGSKKKEPRYVCLSEANLGSEMGDQLAKDAASNRDGDTAYSKIPKSAIIKK